MKDPVFIKSNMIFFACQTRRTEADNRSAARLQVMAILRLEVDWKWTGSGLEMDWKWIRSGLKVDIITEYLGI